MSVTKLNNLSIRKVKWDDRRLLFEWANDPICRRFSFHSNPIQWQEHISWFHQKLKDPNTNLFLLMDSKGVPMALVRFERSGYEEYLVGINVDSERRNKGVGTAALTLACETLFKEYKAVRIVAKIKKENRASIRAFSNAGFKKIVITLINDIEATVMELHKN